MDGILLIVSGPAGSGKNTVCERLIGVEKNVVRAITSTTRSPRGYEKDGVDYYFLSEADFKSGIANGDFYEWAQVHGRFYGTGKNEILDKLGSGKDVVLIIDVKGAKKWREIAESDPLISNRIHFVFIRPKSLEVIRERMSLRGDSLEEIERRLQTARAELQEEKHFDCTIVSASKDEDFYALCKIYQALKA